MNCPHCNQVISDEVIRKESASLNGKRNKFKRYKISPEESLARAERCREMAKARWAKREKA